MIVLYKNLTDREYQRFKVQAALHGAKIDEDEDKHPEMVKRKSKPSSFKFGDPADYEHMTEEAKQKLTEKMMGTHQIWKGQTSLG